MLRRKGINIIGKTSKFLEYTSKTIAQYDNSNKSIGEKIECEISKIINKDPDIQLLIGRIAQKLDIEIEMQISPIVNDATLMIEKYVLAVPDRSNTLSEAVAKPTFKELQGYLMTVALTDDESILEAFCKSIAAAMNQ